MLNHNFNKTDAARNERCIKSDLITVLYLKQDCVP